MFRATLDREFAKQGRTIQIKDGVLSFPQESEAPEFGLLKLAQRCQAAESDSWESLVKKHFQRVQAAQENSSGLSFEQAKKRILLRILPSSNVETTSTLLVREDLPGTRTVLVLDLPESVWSIGKGEAKRWGKDPEELFDVALTNLAHRPAPKTESLELLKGISAFFVTEESLYTASLVLTLKDHPEWMGTHGALVGVPTRQHLIVYPVKDSKSLAAMELLSQLIRNLEKEGPGPVSPLLYYYDGESLEAISNQSSEEGLSLSPSPKFLKAIAEIGKKQKR